MDEKLKETIRNLVANAKTDQALDTFIQWANATNSDLGNSLLLLKGQYSALKRQESLGIVGFGEAGIKRAQISNSVLELLSEARVSTTGSIVKPSSDNAPHTHTIVQPDASILKTILFMGANPPNTRFLQLEVEHSRIASELGDKFKLIPQKFTRVNDIPKYITTAKPNIIHFSGHGKDPKSGEHGETSGTVRGIGHVLPPKYDEQGGIVVFDDKMNAMKIIDDRSLGYLFDTVVNNQKVPLELVVFNSCHSESQAKAIGESVEYVVGSSRALDDDLALFFAEGFYAAIASGSSIEDAFVSGKQTVVLNDFSALDLIVLYKKGIKTDL